MTSGYQRSELRESDERESMSSSTTEALMDDQLKLLLEMLDDLEKCSEVLGEGTLFGLELRRNIEHYKRQLEALKSGH